MNRACRIVGGRRRAWGAPISAVAVLAMASSLAQAAPSFNCARATTDAEREICRHPQLADLDQRMAWAYQEARTRLKADASALAALQASQQRFVVSRDVLFSDPHSDFKLADYLHLQWRLLRAIPPRPRSGFEGDWRTTEGHVWVGPAAADGSRPVNAHSQTHDRHGAVCDFLGVGRLQGADLVVEADPQRAPEGYAGWKLKLQREGLLLGLSAMRPEADAATGRKAGYGTPFCGLNGSLAGTYFPVVEDGVQPCAGVPAGQCRE